MSKGQGQGHSSHQVVGWPLTEGHSCYFNIFKVIFIIFLYFHFLYSFFSVFLVVVGEGGR